MIDNFGREFNGVTGNLDPNYLLKSGPRVPFSPVRPSNSEKAVEFDKMQQELEEINKFCQSLDKHGEELKDLLSPLIERDKAHADAVMNFENTISRPKVPQESIQYRLDQTMPNYSPELKKMNESMQGTKDWTEAFAKAALHKGSLYTHDIYLFQQQNRTNQLLLEMLSLLATERGISNLRIPDVQIVPGPETHHITPQNVSLQEMRSIIGRSTEFYSQSINNRRNTTSGRNRDPSDAVAPQPSPSSNRSRGTNTGGPGSTPAIENPTAPNPSAIEMDEQARLRDLAALNNVFLSDFDRFIYQYQKFRSRAIADAVKKLSGGLIGVSALAPLAVDIAETVKYQQTIREVAYQTEGITAEMSEQQNIFMARGDLLRSAIASGQKLSTVQNSYLKGLQNGYKTQKDTLKVTRAGLALSRAIGSNAEQTTEYFHEMHMSLKLSAEQMAEIARGIRRTANNANITGDSLMKAVQAAKPLLESLKETRSLSAKSTNNIINLTAEMQKLGISEALTPVMKALSSMSDFMDADPKARSMAAILSRGMPPMGGDIFKNKDLMRQLSEEADAFLQQSFGYTSSNIDQASIQTREIANRVLKEQGGVGLSEFIEFSKILKKQSRTLSESLREIDAKIAKTGKYDISERGALFDEKENLRQGTRMEVSTEFSELLSKYNNQSIAETFRIASSENLKDLKTSISELIMADKERFKKIGISESNLTTTTGTQDAIKQIYVDAITQVNEKLKNNTLLADNQFIMNNPEELVRDAFQDTSGVKIQDLISSLTVAEQAAATRAIQETDPILSALGQILQVNNIIATGVGTAITILTGIAGELGIIALAVGAMASDFLVALGGGLRSSVGGQVAQTALGNVSSGASRTGNIIRAARDGATQGMSSFIGNVPSATRTVGQNLGRGLGAVGSFAVNNRVSRMMGVPIIVKAFKPIGKLVRSAFDPAMMKKRIGEGFKLAIGEIGPLKYLRDYLGSPRFANSGLGQAISGTRTKVKAAVGAARSGLSGFGQTILATSAMQGVMSRGKQAKGFIQAKGKQIGEALQTGTPGRLLRGKMNFGEAVFRAARAQERIPVWGKFAKMFGAGATIAARPGMAWAGGLGSAGAVGAAGAAAPGTVVANVASKALLPITLFAGAMLSMKQALDSATNAEKLFGEETSKLDHSHRRAAESAGFLTGILNFLTFGILNKWLGSTGTLTSMLAVFLKDWPLLTGVIQAILVPVKIAYGLLTGLWAFIVEVFKGIWEGAVIAISPLYDIFVHLKQVFSDIGKEISIAFGPVAQTFEELFGISANGVSIIDVLSGSLRLLGKAVGWVFKGLGYLIAFLMKTIVPVVNLIIDIIASLVKTTIRIVSPFISAISSMVGGIISTIMGIVDIIYGVFTLDEKKIFNGISAIYKGITNLIYGLIKFVFNSFVGLWMAAPRLIGNALMTALGGVINWGKNIFKFMKNIGSFIHKLIFSQYSAIGNLLGLFGDIGKFFENILKGNWTEVGNSLKNGLATIMLSWPNKVMEVLLSIPGKLGQLIIGMLNGINDWARANIPLYGKVADAAGRTADAYKEDGVIGVVKQVAVETAKGAKGLWDWGTGLLGFAEGGVVKTPGLAMVGEKGPEVIIPVKEIKEMAAKGTVGTPTADILETNKLSSNNSQPLMPPNFVFPTVALKKDDPWSTTSRPPIGTIIKSLSPRDLMKERGGVEVTNTMPLPYYDYSKKVRVDPAVKSISSTSLTEAAKLASLKREPSFRDPSVISSDAGMKLNKEIVSTAKSATENPIASSRTTGINIGSYSDIFDENGRLRTIEMGRTGIEPVALHNIHKKIEENIASAEPSNTKISSPELEEVAEDTDKMVSLLTSMAKDIHTLLEYLKPSSTSGGGITTVGATKSKIKPLSPPQYHQLSFGRFADSAVKGVINDGVT